MADGVAAAGVACQIGFQSLGSHAVARDPEADRRGPIGGVTGIGGAGAWARDEAYYRRAPWAGKRRLDGVDVIDGALTNPLAHAVATALALDGAHPRRGRHRHRDRAAARQRHRVRRHLVRPRHHRHGGRVTVAATLCAEHPGEPYVLVHGTGGRITFWYKQDRVLLQRAGHGPEEYEYGRTDLLENLVDHLTRGRRTAGPAGRDGRLHAGRRGDPAGPRPGRAPGDGLGAAPRGTAGWSPASTASSRPPPTPSPSTPSWD